MIIGLIRHLSRRVMLTAFGISALAFFTVAARSDGGIGAGQNWSFDAIAKVPDKARLRPNPLERDPQSIPAGRKLYAEHCAECHGAIGEGGTKAPSLRAEEVRDATSGALFWILSNGVVRRGMPVWSKLPEPERWQIVSFLRSLPPAVDAKPSITHALQDPPH